MLVSAGRVQSAACRPGEPKSREPSAPPDARTIAKSCLACRSLQNSPPPASTTGNQTSLGKASITTYHRGGREVISVFCSRTNARPQLPQATLGAPRDHDRFPRRRSTETHATVAIRNTLFPAVQNRPQGCRSRSSPDATESRPAHAQQHGQESPSECFRGPPAPSEVVRCFGTDDGRSYSVDSTALGPDSGRTRATHREACDSAEVNSRRSEFPRSLRHE